MFNPYLKRYITFYTIAEKRRLIKILSFFNFFMLYIVVFRNAIWYHFLRF